MEHEHEHGKTLHIAPMIRTSNREFRELFRILSRRCTLWTEMVVDETLFHNVITGATTDNNNNNNKKQSVPEHLLDPCHDYQHPTIVQIGGIQPECTAVASRLMAQAGYDELNLNLDCPSARVQGRQFGALLMQYPARVRLLLEAMRANSNTMPISVKCRIGIEDPTECGDDGGPTDWDWLESLIQTLSKVCQRFVIHARSVRLQGLNPEKNRSVPPLDYTVVYRLCHRFPNCQFWINGGIHDLKQARDIVVTGRQSKSNNENDRDEHAIPCQLCGYSNGSCKAPPLGLPPANLLGAMLGRAAMDDPAQFWDIDRYWYGASHNPVYTRRDILERYCAVLERLYPRRCCDDSDEITCRLPTPHVEHNGPFCSVCDPESAFRTARDDKTNISLQPNKQTTSKTSAQGIKITSVVIDRSLKPVLGLFFGLPGSKTYRNACDRASRCTIKRNCGPAFLLRVAVAEAVPDELLDQPLVRTEDRC